MRIQVCAGKQELGERAAGDGAALIRQAISARSEASVILATGASQFEVLAALAAVPDISWERVTAFHLDEYIGMPPDHPASFRRYLRERFVEKLPAPLKAFHFIDGDTGDPRAECDR